MAGHFSLFAQLMRAAGWRGRPKEDSEGHIHEAFLRLHEYVRAAQVRKESAPQARRIDTLAVNPAGSDPQPVLDKEPPADRLNGSGALDRQRPAAERILPAQQRLDSIIRLLSSINKKTCEVFVAYRSGFSYEEIATQIHISQLAVRKHIAHAIFILMRAKGDRLE
jgi:DNA-directed RNA polymerase specialized sigma24 family protein